MEKQIVALTIKQVYGKNMFYPANGIAKEFATLLGVKTFNRAQIESMQRLGYQIGQVVASIDVNGVVTL